MRKYNCPLLEKTRILSIVDQARTSQEFVMEGGCFGSLGAEPQALGNFYDFLTKITHF